VAQPRIASFLSHYPTPSGTTTAVRGLSRALIRLGWDVIIYSCAQDGQLSDEEESSDPIPVIRFGSRGRNPFYVDPKLLARISQNQDHIDLLVINGMFYPPNLAVAAAATRARIPYLVCPHGPYHPEFLKSGRWRKLPYGILCERPLLNAASAIQVLADTQKEMISNYSVRTQVLVVPNGFDGGAIPKELDELADQQANKKESLRLLYLGRLDMHTKGLDLLLRAIAAGLSQRKLPPTVSLELVGQDGGDQRRLELLASRLGISQNVRFRARIPERFRWKILSSCDLLVLPSRWDGFGLTVLEAIVAAKPVLVSEEAGISSYVNQAECGYVVQPDTHSIVLGLMRAFNTRREWHSMGRRGREFAYEHLTWDKSAQKASDGYQKLLSGARIQMNSVLL
jgi:glycosyltransferase involved in cell wall biosynthesis